MKTALISAVVLLAFVLSAAAQGTVPTPFESPAAPTPQNQIDELVFARLKKLDIQPANVCSDPVFVRRVYLDVIGTLPTGQEARDFLLDRNPDKRRLLIDRLLEREEFADYWAMKWSDLLRVKAEFPINLWPNAVQAYHRWIRTSIKENKPYDQFVREMLTSSGSNFRVAQVNFYRAMQNKEAEGIAQTVALTFMGERADKWPKDRLSGMAAFFSQVGYKSTAEWKEEIVFFDPVKATNSASLTASFPDGKRARLSPDKDPREVFADWLIDPKNPWFTRNVANRVWSWLLGRGIIHEPDDVRTDNPPSNPQLLTYLEKELIAAKYDLKHLSRLILNSTTYQLSSIPRTDKPEGEVNFAYYPLRRLEAEVLIDALNHQPHPGAVHVHSGRPAFDRAGRRQHHEFVSGDVRPFGARHRAGIRAQQPPHGLPTAAPAQFKPHPAQDRTKPEASRPHGIQGRHAACRRQRTLPDHSVAFPDGEGIAGRGGVCPVRQRERPRGGG
jgi:hypothetical protein